MLKYVLILLFVNTYNCGWGIPVELSSHKINIAPNTLASKLLDLTNDCGSKIISSEIQNKTANCISPAYTAQTLKCLIFYDISKKLCNFTFDLKSEDYNVQINKTKNVTQFCSDTATWPVIDFTIHPEYSKTFKNIFSNASSCTKFCTSQDFMVEDVDFYCKYYKLGLDILAKNISKTPSVQKPKGSPSNLNPTLVINTPQEQVSDLKSQVPNLSSRDAVNSRQSAIAGDGKQKTDQVSPAQDKVQLEQKLGSFDEDKPQLFQKEDSPDLKQVSHDPKGVLDDEMDVLDDQQDVSKDQEDISTQQQEPVNEMSAGSKDKDVNDGKPNRQQHQKNIDEKSEIDKEKIAEGVQEQKVDSGGSQKLEELDGTDPLKKPDGDKPSFQAETDQKGVHNDRAIAQDSIMEDEDDHFFILFLIGVIFVILLYVLYHNKNKVSKVVMGLIVEGRAGRRRNSRGHAYRRLDTLEQAVSASHPTPPAKIIY